jgi:hypothetical protein
MSENFNLYDVSIYVTELWKDYNVSAKRALLPMPPYDFLRNPTIMGTMFVTRGGNWLKKELKYLEKTLPESKLRQLLQEDYAGKPLLLNAKYLTSHNTIHHLYHLIRFSSTTNCELDELSNVVEWGGGYGNMAKIFRRLNKSATYTIIDTPLFSCLQWLYLATVNGTESVNILMNNSNEVVSGKINCMPLCFLPKIALSGELFISTWGLSESSRYSQDYVAMRKWFGAKHLLLAYQRSNDKLPNAERIGQLAQEQGAEVAEIEFLPGNFYALL